MNNKAVIVALASIAAIAALVLYFRKLKAREQKAKLNYAINALNSGNPAMLRRPIYDSVVSLNQGALYRAAANAGYRTSGSSQGLAIDDSLSDYQFGANV